MDDEVNIVYFGHSIIYQLLNPVSNISLSNNICPQKLIYCRVTSKST